MSVFTKVKLFFQKNKELKKYHYGDIIWCYVDKYADFQFEGRHQVRPFVFLQYKDKKIYGYTMTHAIPKKYSLHYEMNYKTDNQFVLLSCLFSIPKKAYKGYMGKLNPKDASKIAKTVYYMHDEENIKKELNEFLEIEENDIVSYIDKDYFVYASDQGQLTLYELTNNKDDIRFDTKDKGTVYINANPMIVKAKDVIYKETFKDLISLDFKEKRKEIKNKDKSPNTNLVIGDMYKSKKGTYVVYRIGKDFMSVINLYSPTPEIKEVPIERKTKTGHISEMKLNHILDRVKELEKFNF